MSVWVNQSFLNLLFWLPIIAVLFLFLVPRKHADAYTDLLFSVGRFVGAPAWAVRQFEQVYDFKSKWLNPGSYLCIWMMNAYPTLLLLWVIKLFVAFGWVQPQWNPHSPWMLVELARFWLEGTWVVFLFFALILDVGRVFRPGSKQNARVMGFIRRKLKAGQTREQIKTELNEKLLYYWLQTLLAHWVVLQVYVLIFGSTYLISDQPPLVLVPLRSVT
ncbi:hypothetical protein [Marinospirillum perlucidum]|uniref:hypothetical protein n=1 Tax=Marinospirillum perlucidum TaxID=1982602 RepID=UPI000DF42533|nr:hypothetical protein [Marinospirillum perlucidum]